jgi:hypothetical protein
MGVQVLGRAGGVIRPRRLALPKGLLAMNAEVSSAQRHDDHAVGLRVRL